jgi:large subunit ribosomal protein L25
MTQEAIKLEALSRDEQNGKAKKIRKNGFVPAVIYGAGAQSQSVKVKEADFKRVFNLAGESHLIDLAVDNKPSAKVIIKDIQKDFLKDNVIHIDFYQVDMKEQITTEIPLNFIGESKAVKELGGTLIKSIDSINVKCLPGDLVDKIDVDLSGLNNFHDFIRLNDLKMPQGMELVSHSDEIVVSIAPPVKEEVMEAAPVAAEEKAAEGAEGEVKEKEEIKK